MIFLQLFYTFFKIGLFGFGGGYAMLSMIQGEVVTRYGWLTAQEFTDIVAISQMTPGPIGINSATYVGYTTLVEAGYSAGIGILGSCIATFAVVLPSFWVIVAISFVLDRFRSLATVQYAFFGIRAGVVVLLIQALWSMFRQCPKRAVAYVVAAAVFVAVAIFDFEVLLVIVCAAIFGIVDLAVRKAKKKGGEQK